MHVTNNPPALPGSCYKCGSGTRDAYIDLDVSVEFHGAMYLCDLCVAEMAGLLGYLTPEVSRDLTDKIEQLESEKFKAQTQAAGLERAINGLMDAGFCADPVAHLHPDHQSPDRSRHPSAVGFDPERADSAQPGETVVAGAAGETPESLHDEGVAELRAGDGEHDRSGEFTFDL